MNFMNFKQLQASKIHMHHMCFIRKSKVCDKFTKICLEMDFSDLVENFFVHLQGQTTVQTSLEADGIHITTSFAQLIISLSALLALQNLRLQHIIPKPGSPLEQPVRRRRRIVK